MSENSNAIKIVGFIWYKHKPDEVTMSGYVDGELIYFQSPEITEAIKHRALEAGKSVGEIVDILNRQLRHEEDRSRVLPWASMTFDLTADQMKDLSTAFGLDWEPETASQRQQRVEGAEE